MRAIWHRTRAPLLWALTAALAACSAVAGGVDSSVADSYARRVPRTVAVLPAVNETPDPLAPDLIRPLLEAKLAERGYEVVPAAKVDPPLKDQFEIVNGYQLGTADSDRLLAALGADALLYAKLTDWDSTRIATSSQTAVGGEFWLVGPGPVTLWRANYTVRRTDAAPSQFAPNFRDQVLDNFRPLARELVNEIFQTLPARNSPNAVAPN